MGAPDDFDLPFDFSDLGAFTSGSTETLSLETREEKEGTKQPKIAENLAIVALYCLLDVSFSVKRGTRCFFFSLTIRNC
jgi:hypothetical protein